MPAKTVTPIKSAKSSALACGYKLDRDERDALTLLDEAIVAAREVFETDSPDADMIRGLAEIFGGAGGDEGVLRKKLDLSAEVSRTVLGGVTADAVFGVYLRVASYVDDKDVKLSYEQMKAAAELAAERFGRKASLKEIFMTFDVVFGDEGGDEGDEE